VQRVAVEEVDAAVFGGVEEQMSRYAGGKIGEKNQSGGTGVEAVGRGGEESPGGQRRVVETQCEETVGRSGVRGGEEEVARGIGRGSSAAHGGLRFWSVRTVGRGAKGSEQMK